MSFMAEGQQSVLDIDPSLLRETTTIYTRDYGPDGHGKGHLGGHGDATHVDLPAIEAVLSKYGNFNLMLDIGCGMGGTRVLAQHLSMLWMGIDGVPDAGASLVHDYSKGKSLIGESPSIVGNLRVFGWSVEFLGHVDEQYVDNFMADFAVCDVALITHETPNQYGWHHVNCQEDSYWVDVFSRHGFNYDQELSLHIRNNVAINQFVHHTGMVFYKK